MINGIFVGSGCSGMQEPIVYESIHRLATSKVKREEEKLNVVYIGTATYELEKPMLSQTKSFRSNGDNVIWLKCTESVPENMVEIIENGMGLFCKLKPKPPFNIN